MGEVLPEVDSGLKTTFSDSDCAKQLQEIHTSRNGKMFPLIFLGHLPSQSPRSGAHGKTPPRPLHNCLGQEVNVDGILLQGSRQPLAALPAKPGATRVG